MNIKITTEENENNIIYSIEPTLKIAFIKNTTKINLLLSNPIIQTLQKECDISEALKYIKHNKNMIGLICSCYINDNKNIFGLI